MAAFLEFEKELEELDLKINELKKFSREKNIDLSLELTKFEGDYKKKLEEIYKHLTPWQRTMVARHPQRPYTLDYAKNIFDDFIELHGDRLFKDDPAIVAGLCRIGNQGFMLIGNQRGRDLQENLKRNFGYANPDGFRKALRLMKTAERLGLPVVTLIDIAGAYPGLEAEERGQGEAIARNLMEMAGLKVPVIAIITGEGGSGGALATGVANKVYILENSIYSVISPEGCAAILYKDASKAAEAADNLKLDANNLLKHGIVDDIIPEPPGGAHRDHHKAADNIKAKILATLDELKKLSAEELIEQRYARFRKYGEFSE